MPKPRCTGQPPSRGELTSRAPDLDPRRLSLLTAYLSSLSAIWHQDLDQTAEALEDEGVETDIWFMDHAMRLRFEAAQVSADVLSRAAVA